MVTSNSPFNYDMALRSLQVSADKQMTVVTSNSPFDYDTALRSLQMSADKEVAVVTSNCPFITIRRAACRSLPIRRWL